MTRHICAFIDVLGGGNLFKGKDKERAADFFNCLEEFERRMNGWSHHFPKNRRNRALVKTFSDNIFVAFPFQSGTQEDIESTVHAFIAEIVHQIYEITILAGFPLRGAITVGSLMHTEKFLFGPALVEAAQLEKTAIFPRIVVSEPVLRYVRPDSGIADCIIQDADKQYFVHYLGCIRATSLGMHKEYVEKGLSENSRRNRERQKYEWLAQYHNFSAKHAKRPEYLIEIERPDAFSFRDNAKPVVSKDL
jgi:hypothetical protein